MTFGGQKDRESRKIVIERRERERSRSRGLNVQERSVCCYCSSQHLCVQHIQSVSVSASCSFSNYCVLYVCNRQPHSESVCTATATAQLHVKNVWRREEGRSFRSTHIRRATTATSLSPLSLFPAFPFCETFWKDLVPMETVLAFRFQKCFSLCVTRNSTSGSVFTPNHCSCWPVKHTCVCMCLWITCRLQLAQEFDAGGWTEEIIYTFSHMEC